MQDAVCVILIGGGFAALLALVRACVALSADPRDTAGVGR